MFERFVGCRLSYVELYDGCRVSYVVGPRDSVVRIGVRTALLNLLTYKQTWLKYTCRLWNSGKNLVYYSAFAFDLHIYRYI